MGDNISITCIVTVVTFDAMEFSSLGASQGTDLVRRNPSTLLGNIKNPHANCGRKKEQSRHGRGHQTSISTATTNK